MHSIRVMRRLHNRLWGLGVPSGLPKPRFDIPLDEKPTVRGTNIFFVRAAKEETRI